MDSKEEQKPPKQSSPMGTVFIVIGILVLIAALGLLWMKVIKPRMNARAAAVAASGAVPGPNAGAMPGMSTRLNSGAAPAAQNVTVNSSKV